MNRVIPRPLRLRRLVLTWCIGFSATGVIPGPASPALYDSLGPEDGYVREIADRTNASLAFAGESTAQTERGDARFFLSAALNY